MIDQSHVRRSIGATHVSKLKFTAFNKNLILDSFSHNTGYRAITISTTKTTTCHQESRHYRQTNYLQPFSSQHSLGFLSRAYKYDKH